MFKKIKQYWNRKRTNFFKEDGDITMEQLEKMAKEGAILLDVRSPQEYSEGHLKNAILLPEYELVKKIEEMIPDKNALMIVYCHSGSRSKRAKQKLEKLGYRNVYHLEKGIENY